MYASVVTRFLQKVASGCEKSRLGGRVALEMVVYH